jgi:methyl-accepting chemotaxis protein
VTGRLLSPPLRLLGRLNVRSKLISVAAVFLAVVAAVLYLSLSSTKADNSRALVDNIAGRQATLVERYVSEVLLASQGHRADPADTADRMTKSAAALLDGGTVVAVQSNDNSITIPGTTDPLVREKLIEAQNRIRHLVVMANELLATKPTAAGYPAMVDALEAQSHMVANVSYDAVGRATTDAQAQTAANQRTQFVVTAIGIILALLFAWLVSLSILRPLRAVLDVYGRLARGDLSTGVDVSGRDELSRMGTALNEVIAQLRLLLRNFSQSSDELTLASGDLSQMSQRLESTATANAASAERSADLAGTITQTAEGALERVKELNRQTSTIAGHAFETSAFTAQAESASAAITASVHEVAEASSRIGEVARAITSIAEQTHLLALNATIEAARAGQSGRGFAVVASEVKNLARQTGDATELIVTVIGTMQERIDQAAEASLSIAPAIAAVRQGQVDIADAVESQHITAAAVTLAMHDMVAATGSSENDVAAMRTATEDNAHQARLANESAETLTTISAHLRDAVSAWHHEPVA